MVLRISKFENNNLKITRYRVNKSQQMLLLLLPAHRIARRASLLFLLPAHKVIVVHNVEGVFSSSFFDY